MRDDFCAFILTHGRPDKVLTYRTLRRAGYTGKIFIVVDDEDKTRHQGNDSNLLIVFYVQIMPDDFVMQLHR
ncbi:hypothetical protein MZE52_22450, partial [Escherichia coli]|nr:hypothetical protein [Escherichia coli]MCK2625265.1 hypothetical protein [Escherichia coli]MCK2643570.1 hypothetical protein [Escherichia coli]MCV5637813.1 hypothetical protein [Escherichia coli]MDC7007566.1 hypothetical protein [Escherichia coli]